MSKTANMICIQRLNIWIIVHVLLIPELVLGSCKEGWTEFQASCYIEERGTGGDWGRDWVEAKAHCGAQGAHVLSIDSMAEMFFIIKDLIQKKSSHDQWWTSGHQNFRTGKWYWDIGKGMTTDNQMALPDMVWYSGQPDNANGVEYYAALLYKNNEWGLNDLAQVENLRFICEYEL